MCILRVNGQLIEVPSLEEVLEAIDQDLAVNDMINFIYQ
jgi:hypothetical protein